MFARVAAVTVVALACAACANDRSAEPFGLRSGAMHVISPAAASELAPQPGGKSMAAKVLSSIAFEKVTGLPTDPARLGE